MLEPRKISPILRLSLLRRTVPLVFRRTGPTHRYASAGPQKDRILEKPAKFNPPSHGRRLKENAPRNYGPELTQAEKAEQETKYYPNMMPPKGTFLYWLLTSTSIHLFITLVSI